MNQTICLGPGSYGSPLQPNPNPNLHPPQKLNTWLIQSRHSAQDFEPQSKVEGADDDKAGACEGLFLSIPFFQLV